MITSNSNQQMKYIQKLMKTARFRKKESLFPVEGWKMAEEAVSRNMVKALYASSCAWEEALRRFSDSGVPLEEVSDSCFREIADTVNPQGILALAKMPQYSLEDYLSEESASFLCLEDLNDPGNLGTILRTAEGAGMTGVLMSKGTADIFNPKTVRSTMGSLFRVPFFFAEDFMQALQMLKEHGVTLYAAHLRGDRIYTEEAYHGKTAILIGNEANGLSSEAAEFCDMLVRIPMAGQLESLNAAVSAALLMYELRREKN